MTTRTFWARSIPGVWFSFLIAPLLAQSSAAHLARGIQAFDNRRYNEAIEELKAAQASKLGDYAAFYLASARVELRDFEQARKDLAVFHKLTSPSPLETKALLLEAKALAGAGSGAEAVRILKARYGELPQPSTDFTLAQVYESAGEPAQAATYYQRANYLYPLSDSGLRAAKALEALKAQLGSAYPLPTPAMTLERGDRYLAARAYANARVEFTVLREELAGADRDMASVQLGATDYLDKKIEHACPYLRGLEIAPGAADAERLYYVSECARRANDESGMLAAIGKMAKEYPSSPWRLKAMLAAANRFLLANQSESYEPLYRACYESFPLEPEAGYWHWKATWVAYLHRRKDAAEMLREQVARYPGSTNTSSALYYLGRQAEGAKDYPAARAYYDKIAERYPGFYYGILAKERLMQASLARAIPGESAVAFLKTITFTPSTAPENYTPTAATTRRIERFRILSEAGLTALAEAEMRFAAITDSQPHLLAMELAAAEEPHRGLRSMKSLVSDYFTITQDAAPERFWQLLFPLPFRLDLVKQASAAALDPNIVAGLVRQESEFNPSVISPAHAYGLTQLIPSTGRQLARQAGVRGFSASMLFQPSMNLRLGTTYLRSLLDQWGGKWEETLASYNAGKTHVLEWVKWADFQEPAEFVETIPFTETREYVQSVMRNAAAYRRIYGARLSALTPDNAPAPVKKVTAPAKKAVKKSRRPPLAG
jgi:soluble lytic murein transglycosylase